MCRKCTMISNKSVSGLSSTDDRIVSLMFSWSTFWKKYWHSLHLRYGLFVELKYVFADVERMIGTRAKEIENENKFVAKHTFKKTRNVFHYRKRYLNKIWNLVQLKFQTIPDTLKIINWISILWDSRFSQSIYAIWEKLVTW